MESFIAHQAVNAASFQPMNHTDVVSVQDLETLISEARHLASEEDPGTVHADLGGNVTTGPHDFIVGRPSRGRPTMLTPELREALCAHLAQGAPIKTACQAVGISKATYYSWRTRSKKARDEPPPTLELTRQGLIDLLTEADVTYPARATKTVLLRLLAGIDEADIMRHTRHKSVQIMRRYDRTSGLWIRNGTTGVSL